MRYNTATAGTGGTTYTPTSSATGNDGETTVTTTTTGSKNPVLQAFWTTSNNWGTVANSNWNFTAGTGIWEWSGTTTNGRPILRGFTANIQTN